MEAYVSLGGYVFYIMNGTPTAAAFWGQTPKNVVGKIQLAKFIGANLILVDLPTHLKLKERISTLWSKAGATTSFGGRGWY